jgi:hypothetical protein
MRWNGEEQWVWSAEPSHEALVPMESFRAVQARMVETRRGGKPVEARRPIGPTFCEVDSSAGCADESCRAAGTTVRPTTGAPTALSTPGPPGWIIRRSCTCERDLLPRVDAWIDRIFEPARIDETCEAIVRGVDANASTNGRAAAYATIR